jgi:Protein of unknown function (DUF998)
MNVNSDMQTDVLKTMRLLTCGVIAGPLFVITFLIEGATRANYNPLRHPVSSLALGSFGWIQIANFVITGVLLFAFAMGLWRTLRPAFWRPLLVGLVGISLIGAGIFITDPINGYPPGTPLLPTDYSTHGRFHDLFGILTFLGLPITCLVFCFGFVRARKHGWAAYSAFSAIAMFVFFILAGMGFSQVPGYSDFAGVFQRLSIISGLGWITLLAIHLRKATV